MTLDPRFIVTSDLEEYFVDSLTGLPLSGGFVYFYSDSNRNALKPVYELTGTPASYSYTPLANPVTLSSVGTFQDGVGNNIVAYYYPFTGTPAQQTGIQELYFIQVYSSDNRLIFTRQAWPNSATSTDNISAIDAKNFIPNGQFLAHNNGGAAVTVVGVSGYTSGATVDITYIAQGGWWFVTSNPYTGTYNNTFTNYNPDTNVSDFPVYAFNMNFSGATNDTIKDLTITWRDANKFCTGNPPGQQPYTYYFTAQSNDGGTYNFSVYIIYSYGSGAGASAPYQSPTSLLNFTVTGTRSYVVVSIPGFPANTGTIVPGANGPDDYVGLVIRCTSANCNVQFTDFVLLAGNITSIPYSPVQTDAQMLSEGVAGWMTTPNPNGLDMYLPLVLTPQGMAFDHTGIGEIVGTINNSLTSTNCQWLLCDGNAYVYANYSALGIPYARLGAVLIANSSVPNVPIFGTGSLFATAYTYSDTNSSSILRITYNLSNAGSAPVGSGSTGWTVTNSAYSLGTLGFQCYNVGANQISIYGPGIAPLVAASAGTSGFTVGTSSAYNDIVAFQNIYNVIITTVAASALTNTGGAGKYFIISNSSIKFYIWYFFTNETDPALAGYTGVKIIMPDTTLTAFDVANITKEILSGFVVNNITIGGLPTTGQYFTFSTNPPTNTPYYVWYNVANAGGKPTVAGTAIQVNLTGTETTAQIVTATQLAINSYQYAVPSAQGMFLRGLDPSSTYDTDNAYRWSAVSGVSGAMIGTYELQQFLSHTHTLSGVNGSATAPTFVSALGTTTTNQGNIPVGSSGGSETRPVNMAVKWFIRY